MGTAQQSLIFEYFKKGDRNTHRREHSSFDCVDDGRPETNRNRLKIRINQLGVYAAASMTTTTKKLRTASQNEQF